MSEITDWEPIAEKPLNANDVKVVAEYVSTLRPSTDSQPETNWEDCYARQLHINGQLILEVENLTKQVSDYEATREQQRELMIESANNFRSAQSRVDSLTRDLKELQDKFTCFKADAVTSLKAIDLCILATLPTEKQFLTHRARNFRMRHIHQIILNEVASFSDRKLTTYEDDF